MTSRIYMIRHGMTEGNQRGWFYGATDLPLTEEGREELRALVNEGYYPLLSEDTLFLTTGLKRTKETLEEIYGPRESISIPELQEMNFGNYECYRFDEIENDLFFSKWLKDEEGNVRLPGGESRQDFSERIARGREALLDKSKEREEIFLVCHGGVVAELLDKMFPEEKDSMWQWLPVPGYGYMVEVEEGEPKWAIALEEI